MTNEKFTAYENLGRNIIAHLIANGKFPVDKCWQLDAMLEAFGYDKLGLKGMFANELKMLCVKHCAYETKTSHAKPIEYVFAKVLEMRDINLSVLNDLHFGTEPSEAQLERIQRAKDSISIKVNASEAGAEPVKRTVPNGTRPKYNKRIDPALSAAIAKASKPNEQYRFDLLLSTLEKEGFHVELKGDVAEVYVDADGERVEAGIIRYSSPTEMAEDLNKICADCPLFSGQRRINISVVINKVLHPEKADNESSAEAAVSSLVGTFEYQDFYDFKNDKNEPAEDNPYNELAEQTAPKTQLLSFDVDLEYQDKKYRVKRQISVLNEEKGFYHGYVYHSNGSYLGHWYWNTKYLWPIFSSKQQNIGEENKARYERAIRKALKGIGIYCKYMPDSADRYSKQSKAAV